MLPKIIDLIASKNTIKRIIKSVNTYAGNLYATASKTLFHCFLGGKQLEVGLRVVQQIDI